jgi:hypothetical protein
MMQNAGMNGMPPPLPGFAFPPQPFPPPPSGHPAPPMAFPPQPPRPIIAASERIHEVVDSDREDGEVSDAEAGSKATAGKVNGRAIAEAPRSVPQTKAASPQVEEGYNPNRPAAGQKSGKEPATKQAQPSVAQHPEDALQESRDQARQFIKVLHSNNVGYRTLAKENLDHDQLRGLYQSLNLPSEPAPILPLKETSTAHNASPQAPATQAVQPAPGGPVQEQKPKPTVKTNTHAVSVANSAPSPVDRKDYIARLQAAKLAKLAGTAKPSPPQQTPPVAAAPPAPAVKPPQAAAPSTAKPPITDEQRARNTEVIKQRLEAMKAKKQSITPATNPSTPASSHIQKSGPARSAPLEAAQRAPAGTTTPNQQPYVPPFPGIPGLFMDPPPSFGNTNSRTAPPAQQKRPLPFDSTELSTPRGSVTPYTRPSGDYSHVNRERPMVIEVSDDESNGSEMDIDEDPMPSKVVVTSSQASKRREVPAAIPDFPSRQTSALPGSSAVSTPGPQTPATQAREQELKTKEDQLAAMRITLKKKLAEKREKDRAAAAAAAASSPAPQPISAPLNNGATVDLQSTASKPAPSLPVRSTHASVDSMNDANELFRDVKRRRREEIQSKLPSFDAELAMNTDRMASLMKEMEQLKAQSEKITKDKEQLTRELESLGVDTEGMSHAEMRAKKDEIEHDISPKPVPFMQGTTNGLATSKDASVDAPSVPAVEAQQKPVEAEASSTIVSSLPSEAASKQSFPPGLGFTSQPASQDSMANKATAGDVTRVVTTGAQFANPPTATKDLVTPVTATATSEAQAFNTPPDDEVDFYSPAPAHEPISENSLPPQAPPEVQTAASPSPSEEGEVEMSLSSDDEEEEEYEPEEPATTLDTPNQNAQLLEADTSKKLASEDVSTEDEEAYEPPEIDEAMPDVQAEAATETNTGGATSEMEADEEAMDIASSSLDDSSSDSDSDSDDGEIASESGNDATISASHALQQPTNIADGLAPELQPASTLELTHQSPPSLANQEKVLVADYEAGTVKFTPYESPLRMFKSYRYHPKFAQDISGGFLSTTYSHQIDATKPLCPFETAGGTCNDAECTKQHFSDLSISGTSNHYTLFCLLSLLCFLPHKSNVSAHRHR